jgi:hypothetical protein
MGPTKVYTSSRAYRDRRLSRRDISVGAGAQEEGGKSGINEKGANL